MSDQRTQKRSGKRVPKKSGTRANSKATQRKKAQAVLVLEEPTPPSPLRGLLPTPPEVAKLVAREVKRLPMTDEARQRVTDGLNLQYYFGGHEVVYRRTPQGVEILAAGEEEVAQFYRHVPPAKRQGAVLDDPPPW